MVKIEFFLQTKEKRDLVSAFYESLGLKSTIQKKYLRIRSTEQTRIVSVTQSRIYLRAQNHRDILESNQDLSYDLETDFLEQDVETNHAHRSHHIPFRIKLCDPLNNSVCIAPALEPKTLGILTSGGDAPGMNSAVWAVIKAARKNRAKTLGIFNGFQGLIQGEIREISETEAAKHMHLGGTFLRSARSLDFKTEEGLKKAVANLKAHHIDSLVIIGGDGTMRGAGKLAKECPEVTVIFIPGSIDNDIPGTESIGAATALHRIIESVDCIESTMSSHNRGFVLEVMGRDCGWLALMAAFASDASYVFLPEYPEEENWPETLKNAVLSRTRNCTYVVLAEGAKNKDGSRITGSAICEALQGLGIDSRSVVLGHTQRGGSPCATDRLIAPILGVAAAEIALSRQGSYAVFYINTAEKILDLTSCIERCNAAVEHLSTRSLNDVIRARGKEFADLRTAVITRETEAKEPFENYAVATVGSVGGGSENIIANLIKYARVSGKKIHDVSVHPYLYRGGKTKKTEADLGSFKKTLQALACTTLVLIGGLDALNEGKKLASLFDRVLIIPCTVSNNVPGTNTSIGADTALDTITALCDNLKINVSRNIAYLVEVHGGACGYLSIATALAIGALDCYFPEETRIIKRLNRTTKHLSKYFAKHTSPQLVIRGNGAMKGICNNTVAKILETDGSSDYVLRDCVLGHVQKGNKATAVDRVRAAKSALFTIKSEVTGAWVVGVNGWVVTSTPLTEALLDVNEDKRRVKKATWLEMARTYRVLN
ncbi:6-phosphofructokinase 1 [Nematocida displodere]|uniref:6-phosphofructokinase n=1 Tax=Nematocida displodere TaxID=1805483 RepID=A0A177ECK6_9MICR|nr:6-phosphofructokinase 1 [Nematocida displodere]